MTGESIGRAVMAESGGATGDGRLSCARAWGIARRLKVSPEEIGDAANRLGVRIVDCQLGCFGSKKAAHDDLDDVPVPRPLAEGIAASLADGRLPCPAAFEIAREVRATPREVGDAATKQQINISRCQLGCFP